MKNPYGLMDKRVWVAGHRGMVGGALLRLLQRENCEVLTVGHGQVDLTFDCQHFTPKTILTNSNCLKSNKLFHDPASRGIDLSDPGNLRSGGRRNQGPCCCR
jgi:hypothetical protein